jgi:hypothetical protein
MQLGPEGAAKHTEAICTASEVFGKRSGNVEALSWLNGRSSVKATLSCTARLNWPRADLSAAATKIHPTHFVILQHF